LLDTVTKVTTNIGIAEPLHKELYATVGTTDDDNTHPGIIGNIGAADYDTVIASIHVDTAAPTLIQRSQLKLFYKLCAMTSGYIQHPEDKAAEEQALRDHTLALAKAGGAAQAAPGAVLAGAGHLPEFDCGYCGVHVWFTCSRGCPRDSCDELYCQVCADLHTCSRRPEQERDRDRGRICVWCNRVITLDQICVTCDECAAGPFHMVHFRLHRQESHR